MNKKIKYLHKKLLSWWTVNKRSFPWRQKRLSKYKILSAELMLRRSTAKAVVPVYNELILKYPNMKRLHKAKLSNLFVLLRPLGKFKARAPVFKELARHYFKDRAILNQPEKLLQIKGIGPYAVAAYSLFGLKQPHSLLDTNTIRIYSRFWGIKIKHTNTPSKTITEIAKSCIPLKHNTEYQNALLDLGALVCKANKCLCNKCPVQELCTYLGSKFHNQ